jgi:DNA-binding YbaB/EbfC family protein
MPDFPFDLSKLDMSSIMETARKLKESMARLEEEMGKIHVESVVGGGMVKVKANARGEIISITIDPELPAMNDQDMLENLVCSGVNQALSEARRRREEQMQKMAGGLGLPGWFA